MQKYPNLFSEVQVGKVTLKNRIAMPPMGTNFSDGDGVLSNRCFNYYVERARGGFGLIIVEGSTIDSPRGRSVNCQLRVGDLTDIARWSELADVVHSYGAKVICQLFHGGFNARAEICEGYESVSSADSDEYIDVLAKAYRARALSTEEVEEMVQKFIDAAVFCKRSKLDGIELHCAHSYLVNQFLSPAVNTRTDKYGGSLENRVRFAIEIIQGIRKACGDDFLIAVRYPALELVPGGFSMKDSIEMASYFDEAGVDLIDISVGTSNASALEGPHFKDGCRLQMAEALKPAFKKAKVMTSGKINTPELADQVIANQTADLIGTGRMAICDPHWPNKAETGRENEIRRCLSCNEGCLANLFTTDSSIRCVLNPYVGYEGDFGELGTPIAATIKNVVVVGGGIAGMQAAITASKRGHKVSILEKTNQLGGQMITAAKPPFKSAIGKALNWFVSEVERQKVDVKFGVDATVDVIKALNPDVVLVGIGSEPKAAPIPGIENAIESTMILDGVVENPEKKNIVVIGGGLVGCETAHYLIENGENVITLLEILPTICQGNEFTSKTYYETTLVKAGSTIEVSVSDVKIMDNTVSYTNKNGECVEIPCDMVVYATGRKSIGKELTKELKAEGIPAYSIGDTTNVGTFRTATRSGFDIAYNL